MQQASPEERYALLHQQLTMLEQRAAARGVGLVALGMRTDGTFYLDETHGNGPTRLSRARTRPDACRLERFHPDRKRSERSSSLF